MAPRAGNAALNREVQRALPFGVEPDRCCRSGRVDEGGRERSVWAVQREVGRSVHAGERSGGREGAETTRSVKAGGS